MAIALTIDFSMYFQVTFWLLFICSDNKGKTHLVTGRYSLSEGTDKARHPNLSVITTTHPLGDRILPITPNRGIDKRAIRGAARLLGINDKSLNAENLSAKLSQTLTANGFQVRSFGSQGIPDTAFALIAEY